MKAVLTCVEYDDILGITLPRNLAHFEKVLVVTSPADTATQDLARGAGAEVLVTDAFYRDGALFNKGLALEEGFDAVGCEGSICVLDADIILPESASFADMDPQCLYGARRHMLPPAIAYSDELDWTGYPVGWQRANTPLGYFQAFHAEAAALQQRPWYPTNYLHAGHCDCNFMGHWPSNMWRWMPFNVLHIGEPRRNWAGRVSGRLDGRAIPDAGQRARALRRNFNTRKFQKEVRDDTRNT